MRQTPAGATTTLMQTTHWSKTKKRVPPPNRCFILAAAKRKNLPPPKNPGRPINFQAIGTFEPVALFFGFTFLAATAGSAMAN